MRVRLLFLLFTIISTGQKPQQGKSGNIHLLSPSFSFGNNVSDSGKLDKNASIGSFRPIGQAKDGFAVRFTVDIQEFNGKRSLLTIPGVLNVALLMVDPEEGDGQNYRAFKMEDGSLPVLEATIALQSEVQKPFMQEMRIGLPIAILKNPIGKHEVILNFDGPKWTLYVDGELFDNDFPIGYPRWERHHEWEIDTAFVEEAKIFFPSLKAQRNTTEDNQPRPEVQYWTPKGHNAWVGDVATIFHNGRYHVFYLFDRRHHKSKFGVGGHYFEHISTTDFINWTEHEAAVPIDEQWETIGTGTPFVLKDSLYISYGLHTSRIYPDSLTMSSRQIEYYKRNGKTGDFRFDLQEAFPSGSTYSLSQDNVSEFKKSGVLFHYSENPSVFTTDSGELKMMANYRSKGTWESESLDSGWHATDPEFPLGGDCTFYFEWGKYEYIIGGFVNLWKRPINSPDSQWEDVVATGKDFYNGMNVPAISRINNGRYLMAGWIPIGGWGGTFLVHELIQHKNGVVGTKWMKELTPVPLDIKLLAKEIKEETVFQLEDSSFILSFEVVQNKIKDGQLSLSFFSSEKDKIGKGCNFQLDLATLTAQYSKPSEESFSEPEKSLREGGAPQSVGNYKIENLTGLNRTFPVKVLVKNSPKINGSIIDVEIAGQNTMVSYREGLTIENVVFAMDKVGIRNLKFIKIKE